MKKTKYLAPSTKSSLVELEGSFCASIVDEDKQEKPTISIQNQDVGATSDYFSNDSEWDY